MHGCRAAATALANHHGLELEGLWDSQVRQRPPSCSHVGCQHTHGPAAFLLPAHTSFPATYGACRPPTLHAHYFAQPFSCLQVAFGLVQFLGQLGSAAAGEGVDPPVPLQQLLPLYDLPPCGPPPAAVPGVAAGAAQQRLEHAGARAGRAAWG